MIPINSFILKLETGSNYSCMHVIKGGSDKCSSLIPRLGRAN